MRNRCCRPAEINYPKACIVLNEGCEYTETLENEIKELCSQNLPEYMIPCEIAVYKDFPRTNRGKVDYRALEKEAEKTIRRLHNDK